VLEKAEVGKVTPPIASARGFWLVSLEDRQLVPGEDRKTVRHILLSRDFDDVKRRKLAGNLEARAEEKARMLLSKLKAGEAFEKIAAEFSEDAYTKKTNGEYMNYRRTSLGPEVWGVVQKLKAGDPVTIVKSKRGFHLVEVLETSETKLSDVQSKLLEEVNGLPVGPGEIKEFLAALKAGATIERKIGEAPPAEPAKRPLPSSKAAKTKVAPKAAKTKVAPKAAKTKVAPKPARTKVAPKPAK